LKAACQEIGRTKIFSDDQKQTLTTVFQKRFQQALDLADGGRVRKYQFTPSRRTVWVVAGRGRDYQVLPDSLFCTCDDYYFRVMEHKKQLCYHIIAQQLSAAVGKYNVIEITDSRYPEITSKFTTLASRE
jgi:predicted nucleic acid-binding Zn finger protein